MRLKLDVRWFRVLSGALTPYCLPIPAAAAQEALPLGVERAAEIRISGSYEEVRLPGQETMGMLGKSLLFHTTHRTFLGPFVASAIAGRRGGFFVLGAEGRVEETFGRLTLHAGVGVGGGGGVAAPVGDGLMWRPSLGATVSMSRWRVGSTASIVDFPSGDIRSGQLGVFLERSELFRFAAPARLGQTVIADDVAGLRISELGVAVMQTRLERSGRAAREVELVGARADRVLRRRSAMTLRGGIETFGAAGGDAAGYMEVLTVAGIEWSIGRAASLGGTAALGAGGGGAVPMGAGGLARATLSTTIHLAPWLTMRAELGRQRSLGSSLRGSSKALAMTVPLAPRPGNAALLKRVEWSPMLLHYTSGARTNGSNASLQTIGLAIGRYASPRVYFTVQGHSAIGGGAGAYAAGFVGTGMSFVRDGQWRAGGELLVGAAGGGGVATGGGAVTQATMWTARRLRNEMDARIFAGVLASTSKDFVSPVFGLGLTRTFAMPSAW